MSRLRGAVARPLLAAAILFLLASGPGNGFAARPSDAPRGGNVRRLGDVEIVGSVERPGVLFLLPRAERQLFPPPADGRNREREDLLRDTRETEEGSTSGRPW